MSPHLARPLLHTAHLLTFVIVTLSGLLLFLPGLRATITGGYSLQIRQAHRWGGVAFAVLPIAIAGGFGLRAIFRPPAQRTARSLWQGLHMMATIFMAVVFTATGLVLWNKRMVPPMLLEHSEWAHDWLTYVAIVVLALHVGDIGLAAVVARASGTAVIAPDSET